MKVPQNAFHSIITQNFIKRNSRGLVKINWFDVTKKIQKNRPCVWAGVPKYYVLKVCNKTHRESFLRINFYHASEKVLTIGRYKVGYVKVAPLDFFQELSKIVIVERKGSNQQGIQNHTARPNICPSAIVLLPLKKSWYIRTYGSKVFYQVAFSFSVYLISL